jgi:predicted Zn finger-like uncharacterized protein
MFRVVPDQLRVSDGWVRCGNCDEVFDANAHMQSPQADTEIPAERVTSPSQPASSPVDYIDPLDPAYRSDGGFDWGTVSEPHAAANATEPDANQLQASEQYATEIPVSPAAAAVDDERVALEPYLEPGHIDLPVMEDAMAPHYAAPAQDHWQVEPEQHSGPQEEMSQAEADEPALSFMPRTEPTSRWGRLFGTRMMVAACVLFALLLGFQFLIVERDRVAATVPAARPLLLAACELLSCTVSAPKQIESIAIDSSAFTSLKPGVYLLTVTLKNASTLALTSPSLELTLTDMQDRPLLRRVILADEFANKSPVLEAGAELVGSIPMSVRAGDVIKNIAGYKLLAFYP